MPLPEREFGFSYVAPWTLFLKMKTKKVFFIILCQMEKIKIRLPRRSGCGAAKQLTIILVQARMDTDENPTEKPSAFRRGEQERGYEKTQYRVDPFR